MPLPELPIDKIVREQYDESDFDQVVMYLDEGNDKHDLILMVMELTAVTDEARDLLVNEAWEQAEQDLKEQTD